MPDPQSVKGGLPNRASGSRQMKLPTQRHNMGRLLHLRGALLTLTKRELWD